MKGTPDFPQCGFSAQTVGRAARAQARRFPRTSTSSRTRNCARRSRQFSNWPTYPQLYVKGELVGGCDIVIDMYRSGELKKLLQDAGAIG